MIVRKRIVVSGLRRIAEDGRNSVRGRNSRDGIREKSFGKLLGVETCNLRYVSYFVSKLSRMFSVSPCFTKDHLRHSCHKQLFVFVSCGGKLFLVSFLSSYCCSVIVG